MNPNETNVIASDHGSGNEITVWVGVPGLANGLPSSGSLLVVEAEPERARELRHVLRERPEALVCEEVLTAENKAAVRWHRFNDARLNGPSDLTDWQQRFPNLRQIEEEQRCGCRLADLLDQWVPREGDQDLTPLHLVLRQGDPLAALEGLGPWIRQLQTVQLMLPWPEQTIQRVEAWLTEQRFDQDPNKPAVWNRNPIAIRDLLLKEKERDRQMLIAANQQLSSDCEALQAEKALLSAKLIKLSADYEELSERQDLTLANIHKSQAEAEKLRNEHQLLQQQYQQLGGDKSEAMQKLAAAEAALLDSRKALKKLFPMQLYREEKDLDGYNEDMLLLHYLQHGQNECRLKTYQDLNSELVSSLGHCRDIEAKLERLEAQFGLAQQQLETMKDLFARLADRQEAPRQAIER